MSETTTAKALRASLTEWVEVHLPELREDLDAEFPIATDFVLIVATEDGADPDSDTFYHTVSSGTSHYRKVGLLKCALRCQLRADEDDD